MIEVTICDRAGELTAPTGANRAKHHNQRACAGVGAETAGGWCGDIVF